MAWWQAARRGTCRSAPLHVPAAAEPLPACAEAAVHWLPVSKHCFAACLLHARPACNYCAGAREGRGGALGQTLRFDRQQKPLGFCCLPACLPRYLSIVQPCKPSWSC